MARVEKLRALLNITYDGDTCSLNMVYLDESVKEVDRILKAPEHYLKPTGGTNFSVGSLLTDWTLRNFH